MRRSVFHKECVVETYKVSRSRFVRLACCGSAVITIALAASYVARSQPAVDPPREVQVKAIDVFTNHAVPRVEFLLGLLGTAAFRCETAVTANAVGVTLEVWKDGELVASDGPTRWRSANGRRFDITTAVSVAEYPGNVLMIRKLEMHEGLVTSGSRVLEVAKPAQAQRGGHYCEAIGRVALQPDEERTVWAMKWRGEAEGYELAHEPDGTIRVTEGDKACLLIVLKMETHPWQSD